MYSRSLAPRERTFGRDVILRRLPDDVAGRGIETRGQAVVFGRQTAAGTLAGRVAEERRVIQFAVQDTNPAVIASAGRIPRSPFARQLFRCSNTQPQSKGRLSRG